MFRLPSLISKRASLAGLLILLSTALLTASAQAAPRPIPIAAYWQKLNDTRNLAIKLESAAPADARAQLVAEADAWSAITSVTLADGTLLPVDSSLLEAQLRADPAAPAQVAGLAEAMAAEGAVWPPPSHTSGDLASLSTILAQPEFQWPVAQPSWLDQLRERLWAFIVRMLAGLLRAVPAGAGFGVGQVLAVVAVLAVAGVLAFALLGLLRAFAAEARVAEEAGAGDEALTAEAASRRAQTLAEGGDNRAAVRYLYLAALLHLEEAGLLRYDRSLTNREYLRGLAARPELADRLRGVVEVFDRVWYGFETLDAAAYGDYAARVAELSQLK
jgi:hypothetical protein